MNREEHRHGGASQDLRCVLLEHVRDRLCRGALVDVSREHGGSLPDGSKPIFASKAAFFLAFFKIYKKITFSRANSGNFCQKIGKFYKILTFFDKFCKILQDFQKSAKILQNFADFFLQKFAEICRF